MDIIYRRDKLAIKPDWHFNSDCPHWPDMDFIATTFIDIEKGDRICPNCIRLEIEISPAEKNPTDVLTLHHRETR